jgi:hypothetical protein
MPPAVPQPNAATAPRINVYVAWLSPRYPNTHPAPAAAEQCGRGKLNGSEPGAPVPPSTTTTTALERVTSASPARTATASMALPKAAVSWRAAVPLVVTRVHGVPATGDPLITRELNRYRRSHYLGAVTALLLLAAVTLPWLWL